MHLNQLFSLEDKAVVITGGSRGLGLMMAEGLAEAGARLLLCSRKANQCEEAAERLRVQGVECYATGCDIADPDDIKAMATLAEKQFGHVDVLINNAGMVWGDEIEDTPLARLDQLYNTNIRGTILCTTEIGRGMIARRRGKIINISSLTSLRAADPDIAVAPAYATTKGALNSLTQNLARYWAKHNITVNAIAPGVFPSRATRGLEDKVKIMEATVPLGRLGGADDLKGVAVFLASAASDYITGHVLVVDGGALT